MPDFVTSHPVARKPHWCSDCGRVIDPGEKYRRGVGFDGTAWTWRDCAHCEAVLTMYDIAWDGEYNADHFGDWSTDGARDIPELRHQAGYRMQWRTQSGKLVPVPGLKPARSDAAGGSVHDRDRMGICRKCGHGITGAEILDGESPCAAGGSDE